MIISIPHSTIALNQDESAVSLDKEIQFPIGRIVSDRTLQWLLCLNTKSALTLTQIVNQPRKNGLFNATHANNLFNATRAGKSCVLSKRSQQILAERLIQIDCNWNPCNTQKNGVVFDGANKR